MICAELAGIRVFVTGGIGGVHRGAETSFDISADLQELAHTFNQGGTDYCRCSSRLIFGGCLLNASKILAEVFYQRITGFAGQCNIACRQQPTAMSASV